MRLFITDIVAIAFFLSGAVAFVSFLLVVWLENDDFAGKICLTSTAIFGVSLLLGKHLIP